MDNSERVKLSYKTAVDMKEIMDGASAAMIHFIANSISVPDLSMVPLLLTTTAHHLNGSKIQATKTWEEPSIIFTAVVGYPGTNKSRALTTFRTAVRMVEKAKGISESCINQGMYIESCILILDLKYKNILLKFIFCIGIF